MANRTVNQLPGTLDRTTIAGTDKLLVDDVSDLETKSITVDEFRQAMAEGVDLQSAYTAGRSIDAGSGPIAIDTPTTLGAAISLTANGGADGGLMIVPLGIGGPTAIVIQPDAITADDVDGRDVQVWAGNSGPTASGTPRGGTLDLDAGAKNAGTYNGRVKLGRTNAAEITSGVEGTGSTWTHEGDFTVVDPGGLTNRMQVQAGGVTVAGTLKRKSAVRTVTTSTVLTADDQVVIVDASAGAITLTAPDPADLYEPILILKKSTGANAISIATPSGQINGAASPQALPDSTSTLRPSWTLFADGTDTWSA